MFADVGLNRWLTEEREEAYSDWLEWILGQLQQLPGKAANILAVLGIADSEIVAGCESGEFKIKREYYLQWGRLDLLLTIEDFLMVVIEVKKYSAEASDTAKQRGYYEWLRKQHSRHLKALLLVPDAAELEYENFSRLLWDDVCIRLRRLLPEIQEGLGPVKAAMFVAFISAVETNLLNLVAPEHADSVERISYARTIKHIEKYLRGGVA
ncbi:MAG: PD-(D/E)XK nuclease family protein [Candidatus Sulfotelmatobacter sp.]